MASALRQVLDDPIGQPQRIPIYRNEPEFIDRINNPQNYPVIQNPDGSVSTHRMAAESDAQGNFYVFPTIQMEDGRLVEYEDNRQAMDAAFRSGNILQAPNMLSALRYAEGGYKQGTPLAEDKQAARRELEKRGVNPDEVAQAPVPSNQSVMAAPTSINPFNPAFKETARSFLNNYFGGSNIAGREGYRTGQLVDTAVDALDFIPGVGDAMGVGDLRQSIGSGDLIGTAIDTTALAAGMIPVVGDAASKGIKTSESSLRRYFGGDIPEVTRDTELLMRVGDPKSVNEMTVEMTDPVISSAPIVSAEDLVDRPFITGMSDTSRSGLETVTSVNDVPVNAVMRGGKYFGLQPQNLERGIAFASAPGAVMGQLNRAEAAQALGGRPVAFIPFGMRPASPDFATMSTDIMVPYAQQVMSRSDKIALDRRIREGKGTKEDEMKPIPNWVGIDNATPEYLKELGGDRKAVTKALDEFRDAGSLSRSQARAIVTDPTQFEPVFGDIDMIYELDPQAVADRRFLDSDHPSYESALMGRPLGALRDTEKVNIFEFNPLAGTQDKGFYNFRQKQLDAGRDFPIGGSLSSPTMKAFLPGGHGVITRDMVDDLVRRGLVRP